MKLPRLYAILDAETCARHGMAVGAMARKLRDAGVWLVQYRDKINGPQKILRAAEEIAKAFAGTDATLLMNDRADLAALLGWGVHVGQDDLSVTDVRNVLGSKNTQTIGVSTHSDAEIVSLRSSRGDEPDYIAIGPVFATGTKANASPVVGLEGVRRACQLTAKPLVAIGGITLENARSVIDAGADSVAVISGLFVERKTVTDVARDFLAILA